MATKYSAHCVKDYFIYLALDEAVKEVVETIRAWLNNSLGGGDTRIVVTDLEEDIKDGMVLKLCR